MNINATSSVLLTFTCSWTLQAAVLWYRPPGQQYFLFCFQISENLHPCLMIRWWWSGWQRVILSWCWPREDRGEWQRPRSGPRTSEWMTSVLITVRSDSTQPCRLCTRIRSPGLREIHFPLIGCKDPDTASDWPIPGPDRLQCSLSLGHWTLSPDQTITNIFTPSSSTGSKLYFVCLDSNP